MTAILTRKRTNGNRNVGFCKNVVFFYVFYYTVIITKYYMYKYNEEIL